MYWLEDLISQNSFLTEENKKVLEAFSSSVKNVAVKPDINERLIENLLKEVDRNQAELFVRRFSTLCNLLKSMKEPLSKVYLQTVLYRAEEIVLDSRPIAVRIRALTDYYTSYTALLYHSKTNSNSLEKLVKNLKWESFEDVEYSFIKEQTTQGPVRLNILKIKNKKLLTVDIRNFQMPFNELCNKFGAIAAVSGGFFLYSEPDIELPSIRTDPVGILITDGKLISPPFLKRSALLQWTNGDIDIDQVGPEDLDISFGDMLISNKLTVNRSQSLFGPNTESIAIVGNKVIAKGKNLKVPLNGIVIPNENLKIGDELKITLKGKFRGLQSAIAGGPRLINKSEISINLLDEQFCGSAPPLTFSNDETFDNNLLPRMGVGIDVEQNLFFVAVDGRDFFGAPGMTLQQLADTLKWLGCYKALNLDGGSSKRMVLKGRVLDISSTELIGDDKISESIRPVHNAIFIQPTNYF